MQTCGRCTHRSLFCDHISIQIEERPLCEREYCLKTRQHDPGRLLYESSYALQPRQNQFDVYFREDVPEDIICRVWPAPQLFRTYPRPHTTTYPTFPAISLIASVNIIIRMRTGTMGRLMDLPAEAKRQRRLGIYLMDLWDANPRNFRDLD